MRLSVLGCTGSIGRQTLDIVRNSDRIELVAIAAMKSVEEVLGIIREFHPLLCCMYNPDKAEELKQELLGISFEGSYQGPKVVSGMEGLIECAVFSECDTVMISVVGMIGIRPTIAAIQAGKNIAQANKEPVVCAGHIIMPMMKEYGVHMTPVDSEHSAIYQCLVGEEANAIDRIYLTCSGGPFRGKKRQELTDIRPEDALKHPNWSMGAKITIDSSTLINKGLEVIEAHYLFDTPVDKITVLVQPGSVVHSMVQFEDGAIKAQLGVPDMRVPIAFALNEEKRFAFAGREMLSLEKLAEIRFLEPDMETFKGLKLGIEAGKMAGTMPTVYNAANEELVSLFLNRKISYLDIADGVEACMNAHNWKADPEVEEIFAAEQSARAFVRAHFPG